MGRYVIVDLSIDKVVAVISDDGSYDPGTGFLLIQSDTAVTGWLYDEVTTILSAPPPTPSQQLASLYAAALNTPYTFGGNDFIIYYAPTYIVDVVASFYQDQSKSLQINNGLGDMITITRGDLVDLFSQLYNQQQRVETANTVVQAAINASTLTDYTLVEAAFSDAMDATTTGDELTTLAQLIDIVSELSSRTAADVALTGLSTSTASAVTDTDDLLTAIGKLQAQITALTP